MTKKQKERLITTKLLLQDSYIAREDLDRASGETLKSLNEILMKVKLEITCPSSRRVENLPIYEEYVEMEEVSGESELLESDESSAYESEENADFPQIDEPPPEPPTNVATETLAMDIAYYADEIEDLTTNMTNFSERLEILEQAKLTAEIEKPKKPTILNFLPVDKMPIILMFLGILLLVFLTLATLYGTYNLMQMIGYFYETYPPISPPFVKL
ncbi:MAG: hypothetical protein FWG65_05960 [Turicibacter sp.]|nr:hypothetical protein [Turicibacter sp.]